MTKKNTRDWTTPNFVKFYMIRHIFDTEKRNGYIGSTTNLPVRKCSHQRRCRDPEIKGHDYQVYKYIRDKGGFSNFVFEIIEEGIYSSSQECDNREYELMEIYNCPLNKRRQPN